MKNLLHALSYVDVVDGCLHAPVSYSFAEDYSNIVIDYKCVICGSIFSDLFSVQKDYPRITWLSRVLEQQ